MIQVNCGQFSVSKCELNKSTPHGKIEYDVSCCKKKRVETYIDCSNGQPSFKQFSVACSALSQCLKQYWLIVNMPRKIKKSVKLKLEQKLEIYLKCLKTLPILVQVQCVNPQPVMTGLVSLPHWINSPCLPALGAKKCSLKSLHHWQYIDIHCMKMLY